MTITVNTCPRCNALVMSDAAECHLCHYVFDQHRSRSAVSASLPSDAAVADDLEVCAKCGDSYRKGLVRCSSCGAFTQPEIEAEYQRRLQAAASWKPERFDLPDYVESGEFNDVDDLIAASEAALRGRPDTEVEFELTATDNDFDFELADNIQLAEDHSGPAPQPATYSLRTPPPEPASPPSPPAVAPAPSTDGAADRKPPQSEPEIAHSEATAADVLLEIAKQEEADLEQSRKQYRHRARGSFIVYCPRGCRIRVTERHRGRSGKCPRCGSTFQVPLRETPKPAAKPASAPREGAEPAAVSTSKSRSWMNDIHCHAVAVQKLKIKPDSLLKAFQPVDVVFAEDGLVLATLVKPGGLFGGGAKKILAVRAAAQQHLEKTGKLEGLPVANQRLYPVETLKQIAMAQPTPPDVESIFGGIPVFGASRIAVRLPKLGDETTTQYLSFDLTQFREFVERLKSIGGPEGLGADTEVPLTDTYNTLKCHYTDQPVQELINLSYYQGDANVTLQVSGWRCAKCSLVISEDARKKEKIGGLDGKGIAKAKCPKCGEKFGKSPLYQVASTAPVAS